MFLLQVFSRRAENSSATNNALVEALKKTVGTHLFHRVKFITCSKDELKWGGPIQMWVYQNLGFTTKLLHKKVIALCDIGCLWSLNSHPISCSFVYLQR